MDTGTMAVVVAERPHGTYTRQIFLGDTLGSEGMQADCEHGVLTLTIPVAETTEPGRVQVGGSSDAQTMEPQAAGGAHTIPRGSRPRRGGADRDELSCRSRSACSAGAGPAARGPFSFGTEEERAGGDVAAVTCP